MTAPASALASPASRYRWNAVASRYLDERGKFVGRKAVRTELDYALEQATRRARALAEDLRRGAIPLDAWRREIRGVVKQVHLYSAASAKGGWAQLSPADYGRIGRLVRDEYAFLERFRGEIASGKETLDGRFLARVELYTLAGRQTYHSVERAMMAEHGQTEERSILGDADHCEGCLAEAAAGWVPIGTSTPIGQRTCGRRCKCRIAYR